MPTLKWIGKKDIKNHHNNIEYRILDCKETIGEENTGNFIIKGDNLLSLKSLLPYYIGQVKMIYIDPPYNTGNTSWVYNDNVDSPIIKKWLNNIVDSSDLSRTDKWLCMMYPRLKLLEQFLTEDGFIFVSIDDYEISTLKLLMDSIFKKNNFIGIMPRYALAGGTGQNDLVSSNHDYVIMYAKNKTIAKTGKIKLANDELTLIDEKGRLFSKGRELNKWGAASRREDSPTMWFPIINKQTGEEVYPIRNDGTEGRWRWGKKKLELAVENDEVLFEPRGDGTYIAYEKIMEVKEKSKAYSTFLSNVGTNAEGTEDIKKLFNDKSPFSYPKPVRLIKELMKIADIKDNDLILDSFAGSGSTAQAVLEYNKENNYKCKFILTEMEDYAKELTAERIKRVILGYQFTGKKKYNIIEPKKITASNLLNTKFMTKFKEDIENIILKEKDNYEEIKKEFNENVFSLVGIKEIKGFSEGLGGGFQYCELSEPLLDEFGLLNETVSFEMLSKHIFFTEFGIALNIEQLDESKNLSGIFEDKALYIFLDKRFNILSLTKILEDKHAKYIVYADSTTISKEELNKHNITFKKIPFDIKGN
ncbi:site-specific DNA-methyltransferase [Aliarcobacter butzleri]|uniref:site-specific DNA-methyltransferase n=1 Tax=Aliarcobacter butzleri TaxID=28197 RepID=UPI0024DE165F|nr:site-specific DNA-methyltransferase [Aliarcobacter butzleri]MDK2065428.1 site-specific DNA-methyltransferase [Aliarcobacter butzleri]